MRMRKTYGVALPVLVLALGACDGLNRDNPADPSIGDDAEGGIELVAVLPLDADIAGAGSQLLTDIRFTVSAEDMNEPITGTMNLVGDRAMARVREVPVGADRIFRVDAFDVNDIRTFSVADTLEVGQGFPEIVPLTLRRLTGSLELTSDLPPEVIELDVVIAADADSISTTIEIDGPLKERFGDIPTGTGIRIFLSGRDVTNQVVVEQALQADIRADLVAHVSLPAEIGALHVTANFPGYVPIAPIDRFSDSAGRFFKRSVEPRLPGPDEAIDFDEDFLQRAIGPNGEVIEFYNFDVRPTTPAPVYQLVDTRGDGIDAQLLIFDEVPGEPGYNDLRQVSEVVVTDRDFRPNSATSFQDIEAAGYEIEPVEKIIHCVMVPDGSVASKRWFKTLEPTALQNGWYRDQIVKFLLFENPKSTTIEISLGEVSTPQMYAFFDNDEDATEGFALDGDGSTHNVFTSLPGLEGYSPLWALRLFKLIAFDRVTNVADALSQASNEENKLTLPDNEVLHVNAPVVAVLTGE